MRNIQKDYTLRYAFSFLQSCFLLFLLLLLLKLTLNTVPQMKLHPFDLTMFNLSIGFCQQGQTQTDCAQQSNACIMALSKSKVATFVIKKEESLVYPQNHCEVSVLFFTIVAHAVRSQNTKERTCWYILTGPHLVAMVLCLLSTCCITSANASV